MIHGPHSLLMLRCVAACTCCMLSRHVPCLLLRACCSLLLRVTCCVVSYLASCSVACAIIDVRSFARAFVVSSTWCNQRRNYYTRMAGANKFSSLYGPKKALKLRGRSLAKFLRIKLLISQLAITTAKPARYRRYLGKSMNSGKVRKAT